MTRAMSVSARILMNCELLFAVACLMRVRLALSGSSERADVSRYMSTFLCESNLVTSREPLALRELHSRIRS